MIIDRYLVRLIAGPMLLIVALLFALFVSYTLTRFLTDAAAGLLSLPEVLRIILYRGAIALEVLAPISLYIAVVVGLGRLYSEFEMDALKSAGMSRARILRPIVLLATLVALVVWLSSMFVRPWAYSSIYELQAVAESTDELERIKAGQFYHYDGQDRTVFVAERGKRDELGGVFVRTRSGDSVEVIASDAGIVREFATASEHELELLNARVFRADRDQFALLGQFGRFQLMIPAAEFDPPEYKPKSAASAVLARSTDPMDQAEYQWRLSTGVSTLLLALLAVPLSRSLPRQGRYAKLMIAVGIYAAFYILMGVARTWVEQQELGTIWWAPALLAVVVFLLYTPWRRGGTL
ncbi:MAG: LPS export ABC transporter permease LptF [Pseudomonadota bacterium]